VRGGAGVLLGVPAAAPGHGGGRALMAPTVAAAKEAIGAEYIKYVEED